MEVYVRKDVHAFEYVSFTELKIDEKSNFYCEKLDKYVSIVKSWSEKMGKFCLVENNSLVPIDFCPSVVKK